MTRRPYRPASPRPAYRPPSRGPGLAGWVVMALVLALGVVFGLATFGDRTPVPPRITEGASTVATQIAPEIFPPDVAKAAEEADFRCRVARVTDGDTLRCQDGTRIRLHAISARESDNSCSPGHPCATTSADEATRILSQMVAGKVLDCMTTGQSYNRVTAICWTPERIEVNCRMVETGAAKLWERFDKETRICRHKRRIGAALR